MEKLHLSNLKTLEAESIHIMREVAAEFERPRHENSVGFDFTGVYGLGAALSGWVYRVNIRLLQIINRSDIGCLMIRFSTRSDYAPSRPSSLMALSLAMPANAASLSCPVAFISVSSDTIGAGWSCAQMSRPKRSRSENSFRNVTA